MTAPSSGSVACLISALEEAPMRRRLLGLSLAFEMIGQGLMGGHISRILVQGIVQPLHALAQRAAADKDRADLGAQPRVVGRAVDIVLDDVANAARVGFEYFQALFRGRRLDVLALLPQAARQAEVGLKVGAVQNQGLAEPALGLGGAV